MAHIRIKIGSNEIEVDSRDFYVDNDTVQQVVEELIKCIPENQQHENKPNYLSDFDSKIKEAEFYEPELEDAGPMHSHQQIREGLRALHNTDNFFESPRTIQEITQRMQKSRWLTNSKIISKVLTDMTNDNEVICNYSKDGTEAYVSPMCITSM